jgi:hypothetical protein
MARPETRTSVSTRRARRRASSLSERVTLTCTTSMTHSANSVLEAIQDCAARTHGCLRRAEFGSALVALTMVKGFGARVGALVALGVGTALVYPALLAAVGDIAQPSRRGVAIGVYRLWRDLGCVAGALLAGFLADAFRNSAGDQCRRRDHDGFGSHRRVSPARTKILVSRPVGLRSHL